MALHAMRRFGGLEACAKPSIIVLTFPPQMTHLLRPIDISWAGSFKSLFSELFPYGNEERLRLASGVAGLDFERASVGQRPRVEIVRSTVGAARSATKISTCSVALKECGLLPFDASKTLEKRCVRDVDEDPELDEIRAHPQAWHTGSTVLTRPEWLADATERLPVRRRKDNAKTERALQRKQQRNRRKTKVIGLRRATPTASEREDDQASEVLRAERDEDDEWPEVDVVRGTELDSAVFATVKRELAMVWDDGDHGEVDDEDLDVQRGVRGVPPPPVRGVDQPELIRKRGTRE
jgi:hypothetical protein